VNQVERQLLELVDEKVEHCFEQELVDLEITQVNRFGYPYFHRKFA
jgi:hypothetical protein